MVLLLFFVNPRAIDDFFFDGPFLLSFCGGVTRCVFIFIIIIESISIRVLTKTLLKQY